MGQAAGAIVQNTLHSYLCKLLMGGFWTIVRKDFGAGPQQHLHIDSLAYRVSQDVLKRQLLRTPELDSLLREPGHTQLLDKNSLFGAAVRSRPVVRATHHQHMRGNPPVREMN